MAQITAVYCSNTEVQRGLAERACSAEWLPEGEIAQRVYERDADEYTQRLVREVGDALRDHLDLRFVDPDQHFHRWHGGGYGSQAPRNRWHRLGCAANVVVRVQRQIGDDGMEWHVIEESDWSDDERQAVDTLALAVDAAIDRESESIRHEYARDVMREMQERIEELEAEAVGG